MNEERFDDLTVYKLNQIGSSVCIFTMDVNTITTIPVDRFKWNIDMCCEECLTLRAIGEQAKRIFGGTLRPLYVWVDGPLHGEIYQTGNYRDDDSWVLHGRTKGYA